MDGYCASKHAVVGLMRSWANWLAPHGIRVNTVHLTGVRTPMIDKDAMRRHTKEHPSLIAATTNLVPVEIVEPMDISNAAAWLVSDAQDSSPA